MLPDIIILINQRIVQNINWYWIIIQIHIQMIEGQENTHTFAKNCKYTIKNSDDIFDIRYVLGDSVENKQKIEINPKPVSIAPQKPYVHEPTTTQKVQMVQKSGKKGKKKKQLQMKQQDFQIYAQFNKINKKKFNVVIEEGSHKTNKNKGKGKNKKVYQESDSEDLDQMYNLLMADSNKKTRRSKSIADEGNRNKRKDKNYERFPKKQIFEEYIDIDEIEQSREDEDDKYFKGFVEFHERGKNYAKIMTKEVQGELIAEGIHKNRCIHGDEVYFEILDDSEQKIKCKVVAILPYKGKKTRRQIVGKIQFRKDQNKLYLVPSNKRIYTFDIKFNQISKQILKTVNQKYYLAEFTEWKINREYPQCKIICEFGKLGDIQAETGVLLVNNGVQDEQYDEETINKGLSKFIERADENGQYKIPESQIKLRKDLRNQDIFTIDPLTARDFDDALSIDQCGEINGKKIYEIGVHIADASYFVEEGGSIDQIAQKKTTSVYLVHRVIPMLPRILCETMCSLNPGLQRLTLSVWFKIDEDGQIQPGCRYDKTVIKSKARFTYEQAQQIIKEEVKEQGQIEGGFGCMKDKDFGKIASDIKIMNNIAMKLRQNRINGGSLIFQTPKKIFQLDENLYPKSYKISQRFEANFLVQEYMLLANQKVGEILVQNIGQATLLRKHAFPGPKKIANFQKFTKSINKEIIVSKSIKIQEQINKVMKDPKVKGCIKAIMNYELIFLLEMAEYFVIGDSPKEQWLHYALNMPIYTHFTSPIRRYPDIIVHRQLCAVIEAKRSNKKTEISAPEYKNLKSLVERCNQNKMSAKKVSSGCQKIFLCLYLKQHPVNCKAVLTDMNEYCLNVSVPLYDFRSTIQLKQCKKLKLIKIKLDNSDRKVMEVECSYEIEEKQKKMKLYLKQMQEIDIRLTATQGFPIDYQIRLLTPHPEKLNEMISFD